MKITPWQPIPYMAPGPGLSVRLTVFLLPLDTLGLTRGAQAIIDLHPLLTVKKPILLYMDLRTRKN